MTQMKTAPLRDALGLRKLVAVDLRCSASRMPKSDDFDCLRANSVDDAVSLEENLAYCGILEFRNNPAAFGKSGQAQSFIDEVQPEPLGYIGTALSRNKTNDGSQIISGSCDENYFE